MLRGRNRTVPAMALSLGIWCVPASVAEVANEQSSTESYQPPTRGEIWGLMDVEWSYSGEVIVTDIQGRFCEGFRCAHGRGKLGTDGGWDYSGTFRYGDIVGEGEISKDDEDDGEYSGLFSSASFPGGPAPLCGEPGGEGVSPVTWPGYRVQFGADKATCLEAWVRRVDRGEVLPQEEAQRIRHWYEKIRTAQLTLLDGQSRRTFDKVTLAGTDMREFLVGRGWRPLSGASVYIQRRLRPTAELSDTLQLIFHKLETPYTENPELQVSEMLPMQLGTGPSAAVVEDPWVAVGLVISIDPSGYVVALREPAQ